MTACHSAAARGAAAFALVLSVAAPGSAQSFKVANWNIRSGQGLAAMTGLPRTFNANTSNCTDRSKPLNAWGVGVPQQVLAQLDADPTVVALGLQEAWLCGSPQNVARALGWKAYVPDYQNGTSLVARHGFAGPVVTRKLTSDADESSWVVRAPVCLDAACTQSVAVHVTHFTGIETTKARQAQETLDFMLQVPQPRVLVGDFNAYDYDPRNPCGDHPVPAVLQRLRDWGYTDAWAYLYGTLMGNTAGINKPGCGVPSGAAYKRIDYSWSKGLRPVSMTRLGIPAVTGSEVASDHYAIVAEYGPLAGATPPPPPPPSGGTSGDVVLYASRAQLVAGNYQLRSDATAAGGAALANPNAGAAKLTTPLASPTSFFEMTFKADANKPYRLWIRGKAQNNSWSNDSVYVQFSDSKNAAGSAAYRIGTTSAAAVMLEQRSGAGVHGWGWVDNGYGGDGAPIYFGTTGDHRIRVQVREDGLTIDQIVLSPGTFLTVAPGAAKDDTTILPLP